MDRLEAMALLLAPVVNGSLSKASAVMRLNLPDHPGPSYTLSAIYRRDSPSGPAACWLLKQFVATAA